MGIWITILAICYSLFAVVGVTGNGVMIIATLKSRKLLTVCHYLIFSLCLADLLHLLSQIPNSISLFADTKFQSSCFFLLIPSLIGAVSSSLICLALGVDRLMAVVLPNFYRRIQAYKFRSLAVYSILPICYTFWIVWVSFKTRSATSISICAVRLALNPVGFSLFSYTTVSINLFICFIYFMTWIIVQKKTMGESFKRIFKSITLTVMLVVFGWFATMIVSSLSFILIKDFYTQMLVQMYAGFFVNSSACANIFVYYSISSEYRDAVRSVFFGAKGRGTRVTSIASKVPPSRVSIKTSTC